ncbi:hypothetical protein AB9P05_05990 [Roseivirga sp. BDSF3-8]|uniref:hypothetical protein n=1 Tax=Roseivirga sp. BDSF3-8 TaxID=3241598 RepID=UPI0035328020
MVQRKKGKDVLITKYGPAQQCSYDPGEPIGGDFWEYPAPMPGDGGGSAGGGSNGDGCYYEYKLSSTTGQWNLWQICVGVIKRVSHESLHSPCDDSLDPDGGGGGGSTGGDSGGPDPSSPDPADEEEYEIRLMLFQRYIEQDSLALIENCDQLEEWIEVAQYTPPAAVVDKLVELSNNDWNFTPYEIQNLKDAYGPVVNLDYFPVKIKQFPINPQTEAPYTPEAFLNYIRKNLNDFFEGDKTSFGPYNEYEDSIWQTNFYVGAVMRFEIFPEVFGQSISQDGSVVCSYQNIDKWRFTTIRTPEDKDHPVSGTRQFGIIKNEDGTYSLYTRGVDRVTNGIEEYLGNLPIATSAFEGADHLWSTFQKNIAEFVNSTQDGSAEIITPTTERPDWEKVEKVLLGELPATEIGCD